MIERRISQVTNIKVRRLRGSHHLHLEDAQPVAAEILEFIG